MAAFVHGEWKLERLSLHRMPICIKDYYLTLKWLGMLSLLNDWLSILILVKALKSSGINLSTEKFTFIQAHIDCIEALTWQGGRRGRARELSSWRPTWRLRGAAPRRGITSSWGASPWSAWSWSRWGCRRGRRPIPVPKTCLSLDVVRGVGQVWEAMTHSHERKRLLLSFPTCVVFPRWESITIHASWRRASRVTLSAPAGEQNECLLPSCHPSLDASKSSWAAILKMRQPNEKAAVASELNLDGIAGITNVADGDLRIFTTFPDFHLWLTVSVCLSSPRPPSIPLAIYLMRCQRAER